jgi:hypothetical protein
MNAEALSTEVAPDGGQTVSLKMEGGSNLNIHFPPDLLRQMMGAFEASYSQRLASGKIRRDHLVLTCIAAGIAQNRTDIQLSLSTVETGQTVLLADDALLQSLKNQIDRALSLRGGHETIQ